MAAGQPKPAFYVALAAVVLGLIAFAVYRKDVVAPRPGQPQEEAKDGGGPIEPKGLEQAAESTDATSPTTVKEYKFVPAEKLPPVKGTGKYKPLEQNNNTVRFALNIWAGWAPIVLANDGFKAGKEWKTADGKPFKLDLVLIDNPVAMRDAYASGEVHIGWGTLDMVPLFLEGFVDSQGKPKDSTIMPRIYQQVDFSNGGDGIVVRENIKTVADLRGKKMVMAQNSPSQYFALNTLVSGGVQPSEVQMIYTDDAFQAAAAFNSQKDIAACVSWAPDIYNLSSVKGNRMLVTTKEANHLVADIWFARADFARDHEPILEAITRGIFDAMEQLKSDDARQKVSGLMAAGYSIPAKDALGMLGDAHSTNWAENFQFFLNQNNPTNFERVWQRAYYLYRRIGSIQHQPVPFDQVMDFSIIQKLGKEEKYASQKSEYGTMAPAKDLQTVKGESEEILTNTVVLHFFPNSWDPFKKVERTVDGKAREELYDPNVNNVLEEIAQLAGQFGAARIVIEGHTDGSMRGQVPAQLVKDLSLNRANAIKEALLQKYPSLDPNRFNADGVGWDRPADPADPDNHSKNRRVEVKVLTAERAA
ncbi:Taurine-binding periplasmic protein precursor [Aquisphaera giovannonii]|uniref:Taurine-binding periplasmic protein n=1 Tax=Aquisphaera giovannonii TaxID=406548 RepID=A0A5B9W951_9BACT|nr:phosphate ABC transporter substrate-binding/OmpA family protein [Aquisphaera giovannonii]QEH36729.1 Taurine-binding periplasmic protein precursor [Aquisphaera giovannonii]